MKNGKCFYVVESCVNWWKYVENEIDEFGINY